MPDNDEPKVSFDINQNVLVYIPETHKHINYIPCIPFEEHSTILEIPHLSWIKYRGLARFYGELYMRFLYQEELVNVSLSALPFLEDIPQRNPWKPQKKYKKKNEHRIVTGVKPRSLRYRKNSGIKKRKITHIN